MAVEQVFILDIRRADGSRFVTSVGSTGGIQTTSRKHKAAAGTVSHWRRDGVDLTGYEHPMDRWEMIERFAL